MSSDDDGRVRWLRRQVEMDLAEARAVIAPCGGDCARPCGFHPAASAEWEEMSSGVLDIGATDAGDVWHGVWAAGDSRVTRFIAANDPQSRIAGLEAELAILDQHQATANFCGDWLECQECGPNNDGSALLAAPGQGEEFWPCKTVRLLASGYRHRPGYEEAGWKT